MKMANDQGLHAIKTATDPNANIIGNNPANQWMLLLSTFLQTKSYNDLHKEVPVL